VQEQDFHTFVLLGDGELQEGQVWEAALNAAHYKLRNLVAIVDRNQYSLDGTVDDVMGIEPLTDKWRAFGWNCVEVDGHDIKAVTEVLRAVKSDPDEQRPTVVIAHTVKGKGIEYMESEVGWHLGWLDAEDEKDAYAELAGGLK
jgi:transketolase